MKLPDVMTDADVITAIRHCHLKANIRNPYYVRHHWKLAWVDPGGTLWGDGPYVKLPVDWLWKKGSKRTDRVTIRVYAPARLRRRIARRWKPAKPKALQYWRRLLRASRGDQAGKE
jgi:hypothetical protein